MAEVSTEFTGNNKRLIASYQEIGRENVRLREEMSKLKQASIEVGRASEGGIGQVASLARSQVLSTAGVVTGLLSVSSAVGVVTRAYGEWQRKIEETARAANTASTDMTRMLAQQDELLNAPEIASRLGAMPGVTREQARAAFAGVSSSIRAPSGRRLDLAEQAARVAPLGLDLGSMGALTGAMADISPDLSNADAADLAFLVQSQGGGATGAAMSAGFSGSVRQLLAAGIPREQAIAFALHAESRGAGAGFVRKAAATLKTGKFAKMAAGDRLQALFSMGKGERERAFGQQARGFDVVDPAEIANDAARLGTAFTQDVVGGRVQAAQATFQGRMAAEQQAQAAAADARQAAQEPEAQTRALVREQFNRQLAERAKGFQMFGGKWGRTMGMLDTAVNRVMFEGHLLGLDMFSNENAGARALGAAQLTLGTEAVFNNRGTVEAIAGRVVNTLEGIWAETRKANARGRGPVDEKQHAER